ncbi:MAG: hypothetical protein JWM78_1659 [Verrucomicrobiaceae bacterium]|nr:hypothetical protein [Verrucomicrobiaceae bacterium]
MKKFFNFMSGALLALVVALPAIVPSQAQAGAMSDYLENKLVDALLRAQTYTMPTTTYVALATTTGSDAACGTEVTGGSYARVAITSSLANWAGTQSASSTAASSGTSGTTSNNAAVTFATPTANWGTVTEFCVYDASTSGNLLFRAALTSSKTVNNGDAAPSFAISALTFQIDN